MSNTGNWMHVQYQSKLQARKALSKDGKIFGEAIMIGVKPCIDKVRSTKAIILLVVIVTVVMLHCECFILFIFAECNGEFRQEQHFQFCVHTPGEGSWHPQSCSINSPICHETPQCCLQSIQQ